MESFVIVALNAIEDILVYDLEFNFRKSCTELIFHRSYGKSESYSPLVFYHFEICAFLYSTAFSCRVRQNHFLGNVTLYIYIYICTSL